MLHNQVEMTVMPYLEVLGNFREKVRNCAKILKADDILQECDRLRDDILPNIGVRLEDSNEGACKVKLVNREELLKEKEMKKKLDLEKILEKEKRKAEMAAVAAAKEAQKKISPNDMFKLEKDKYSQFDDKVNILFISYIILYLKFTLHLNLYFLFMYLCPIFLYRDCRHMMPKVKKLVKAYLKNCKSCSKLKKRDIMNT